MMLYGILQVLMVLATLYESTMCESRKVVSSIGMVDKFIVETEDNILTDIRATDEPSLELNLSGRDIEGFKHANVFENVSHVKNLSLANNRISTLPQSVFAHFKDLKHLSLADNRIESLDLPVFQGLNNLASLNISNNPIKELRKGSFEGLGKFTDIITLGNAFDTISTGVFERYEASDYLGRQRRHLETPSDSQFDYLSSRMIDYESRFVDSDREVKVCVRDGVLEKLEFFTNTSELEPHCKNIPTYYIGTEVILRRLGISKFSAGWYRLKDYPVRYLILAHNDIVNVSAEMLNDLPDELRYVDLSHNKIQTLPKGTIVNEYLHGLDFTGNNISEIEESVFEKTKLEILTLSRNRLKKTTFAASLPSTLAELKLNDNHIDELSFDSSSGLENLDKLILTRNNLTKLKPGSLRGLSSLTVLDLTGNKLEKIEKGSFEGLESLWSLTLDQNNLTCLDKGIFDGLGNLTALSVTSNKLTKITRDSFEGLSNLNYLTLSSNHIETLEAGTFVNLPRQRIHLGHNRIKKIENGTFDIESLFELSLKGNFLSQLECESFHGIKSLSTLDLRDNGITKIEKCNLQFLNGDLQISKNPIKRLENGALFGLSNPARIIEMKDVPIELIQGGAFDDL